MIRQFAAAFCALVLLAGSAHSDLVEVIEFFFYGCNACYLLYPAMQKWVEQRASLIDFKRIPALRRSAWKPLSHLFYTLQSMGALPRLHGRVYQAIHEQGLRLLSRNDQIDWAVAHGLDKAQFEATLDSDETLIATQLARDATVAYGVRFTPTIVVGGRFLTTGEMINRESRLSRVLDQLIEMSLATRGSE